MSKPKIIAWAAIAGGEDIKACQYRMTIGGSTKSAVLAKKQAEDCFAKAWPGTAIRVLRVTPIHEHE